MELIEQFLQWLEFNKGRSVNTCIKYRLYLVRLNDYLPSELISAERGELESFVGIDAHKSGMSPKSRKPMVAAIRGFYTWLYREEKISNNPSEAINYPSVGNKLPTAASLQTAEKLLMGPDLNTLKGVRDAAILALLIGGGLRVSGLRKLNESHLLWTEDDDGTERLTLKLTEKGDKDRLLPMTTEARLFIRAYLGHPNLKHIDRTLSNSDKVLFISLRNRSIPEYDYRGELRRLSARSINDMIHLYGEQQGLPTNQLHSHAMRHLFGTEMAESDIDLLQRQTLLGHADPKTTEIYTKLATRKLARVVDVASPLRKIKTPMTDIAKIIENNK